LQLRREAGEHPNPVYFSTSRVVFFKFYSFCFEDRRKGNIKKFLKGKGKVLKRKRDESNPSKNVHS